MESEEEARENNQLATTDKSESIPNSAGSFLSLVQSDNHHINSDSNQIPSISAASVTSQSNSIHNMASENPISAPQNDPTPHIATDARYLTNQNRQNIFNLSIFLIVGAVIIGGLSLLIFQLKTEYLIQELQKNSPSPSPFLKESKFSRVDPSKPSETFKKTGNTHPVPISKIADNKISDESESNHSPSPQVKYEIPIEEVNEFSEYTEQLQLVLGSLKRTIERLDPIKNATDIGGIVKMISNNKKESDVEFKEYEEEKVEPIKEVEASSLRNPIEDILNYRIENFSEDQDFEYLNFIGMLNKRGKLLKKFRDKQKEQLTKEFIDFYLQSKNDETEETNFYENILKEGLKNRVLRALFGPYPEDDDVIMSIEDAIKDNEDFEWNERFSRPIFKGTETLLDLLDESTREAYFYLAETQLSIEMKIINFARAEIKDQAIDFGQIVDKQKEKGIFSDIVKGENFKNMIMAFAERALEEENEEEDDEDDLIDFGKMFSSNSNSNLKNSDTDDVDDDEDNSKENAILYSEDEEE